MPSCQLHEKCTKYLLAGARKKEKKNHHSGKQFCALSSEKRSVFFFQLLINLLLVLWVEREAGVAGFSRAPTKGQGLVLPKKK
jgi:hypothetical protein